MLYFKNKQRNLIDEVSAEILFSDGAVEVLPFLLQADVYKVAVGGEQNLDLRFNYHVSMLSPLRISMDITGTPDKMKFDLVKSRYRDLFIPSRKGVVDSSALLIRKKIREELILNQLAQISGRIDDLEFLQYKFGNHPGCPYATVKTRFLRPIANKLIQLFLLFFRQFGFSAPPLIMVPDKP